MQPNQLTYCSVRAGLTGYVKNCLPSRNTLQEIYLRVLECFFDPFFFATGGSLVILRGNRDGSGQGGPSQILHFDGPNGLGLIPLSLFSFPCRGNLRRVCELQEGVRSICMLSGQAWAFAIVVASRPPRFWITGMRGTLVTSKLALSIYEQHEQSSNFDLRSIPLLIYEIP